MLNLFKFFTEPTNVDNNYSTDDSCIYSYIPDKTIDGENDQMVSICSNDSYDKPFDNIRNNNIRNCLSILADKIDELTDMNNFLSRNNTIILKRIYSIEDDNKKFKNNIKRYAKLY